MSCSARRTPLVPDRTKPACLASQLRACRHLSLPVHGVAQSVGRARKHWSPGDVQASRMTWFVVRTRRGAVLPHALHVQEGRRAEGPGEPEMEDWRNVVDMVAEDITRTNLSATWRPFSRIDCGHTEGRPLSRVCLVSENLCLSQHGNRCGCNWKDACRHQGSQHYFETVHCQNILFKVMQACASKFACLRLPLTVCSRALCD